MRRKKTIEDIIVDFTVYVVLILFAITTLIPFLNILAKSFSESWAVAAGRVGIIPVGFKIAGYIYVLNSKDFFYAFFNTIFVVSFGTAISIILTSITSYVLSKKHIPGVKFIILIYIFTMIFSGGIIPTYLLIRQLGLLNNRWSLILPNMISVFNMLLVKNYFESLPESIEEAALMDGASNLRILFWIILPLSLPVLATVSLFYAVEYWNEYFYASMYISVASKHTLQLYLRNVITEALRINLGQTGSYAEDLYDQIAPESVRAAIIMASTLPILLVYPFLQKHFIKGVIIGSVKG